MTFGKELVFGRSKREKRKLQLDSARTERFKNRNEKNSCTKGVDMTYVVMYLVLLMRNKMESLKLSYLLTCRDYYFELALTAS
jgi:hypothetical protein